MGSDIFEKEVGADEPEGCGLASNKVPDLSNFDTIEMLHFGRWDSRFERPYATFVGCIIVVRNYICIAEKRLFLPYRRLPRFTSLGTDLNHMLKRFVKRSLQMVISRVGRQSWRFHHRSLLILTYHRILPNDHPHMNMIQPGMVVFSETFAMHLKTLKEHFELVHLGDWIGGAKSRSPIPDNACAITFDDGWRDNFDHAFPILQTEKVPVTLFLASDVIGTKRRLWPDRLARVLCADLTGSGKTLLNTTSFRWLRDLGVTHSFDPSTRCRDEIDAIIMKTKRFSDFELDKRLSEIEVKLGCAESPQAPDFLDWVQVKAMTQTGLVQLGSHTRNHIRLLDYLDKDTLLDEVKVSKDIIQRNADCPVHVFCYPDGHWTTSAVAAVRANYVAACSTLRGWNSPKSDPYMLKRIAIHQDIAWDKTAFLARLSGWI